jgi:hypothetical protein
MSILFKKKIFMIVICKISIKGRPRSEQINVSTHPRRKSINTFSEYKCVRV